MVAGLVADGVSAEDTTTGQRRRLSNSGVIVLKRQYVLAEESTERMSCKTGLGSCAYIANKSIPLKSNVPSVSRASIKSSGVFWIGTLYSEKLECRIAGRVRKRTSGILFSLIMGKASPRSKALGAPSGLYGWPHRICDSMFKSRSMEDPTLDLRNKESAPLTLYGPQKRRYVAGNCNEGFT